MGMNLCQLVQHYFVSRGRWQDTEGMTKISGGCALLAPMEWQLGGMWETHSCTRLPSCVCLPSPVSFPSVQWRLSVHSSDPQHPLGQHPAYPPSWHLISQAHGTPAGSFPHISLGLWHPAGDFLWTSLAHGCVLWQQLRSLQGLNLGEVGAPSFKFVPFLDSFPEL